MPRSLTSKRSLQSVFYIWPLVLACGSTEPTPPGNTAGVAGTAVASGGTSAGNTATGGVANVAGSVSSAGNVNSAGTPSSGGAGGASAGGTNAVGGTGGAAGSVSVGGSASGSGSGGAAGAGNGGAGTGFLKEDFESGTTGMQPAGWDNFISYNKNAPNPSGALVAVVDTTRAHSGTKSLHVKSDGAPVQLTKALMSGMNKLYVRVWVYMSRQLGQQTNTSANHETLIALRTKSGDVNNEIRFGEIKGTVGVNETPSDNIAPTMDKWHKASGPLVAASTWSCIEVAFLADSSPNTLKSWQNGATLFDVAGSGTDQWQNNKVTDDWVAQKFGGAPSEVVIGWQSFSSAANEIWFDDLVLSTSPIGCN